jgi:hypothetical protein
MRVRKAYSKMISTKIVALRAFQHAVIHEIGSWLHDSFWHPLDMSFQSLVGLRTRPFDLTRCQPGLPLNSLRLALLGSE